MKTKVSIVTGTGLSILLEVGLCSFLAACGPKEDGSWMMCHHVQNVLLLLGGGLILMHGLALLLPEKLQAKNGLLIAGVILSICCIILPQNVIHMCMMDTMRCHTVMRPGVLVISILGILADLAGVFFSQTSKNDSTLHI